NALGNLFYRKTNLWLDEQNVGEARRSWEKALKFYDAAFQLDGNEKASANLASLKQQIEKRIQSLVSKVTGKIWRDLNGDGNSQKNEPGLKGFVFWDKDGNGEHNSSNEPSVQTNEDGFFAFEWISSKYPVSLELDSKIEDSNGSTTVRLMPMFPAPPPPLNPNVVKNHLVKIESPGEKLLAIPYRAAPLLIGQVWGDKNGNGIRESTESGFKNATLYLDQNGNFAMDENETTFKPQEDGSFAQPVPPGQYSVCVLPDNPDANVTFPLDARELPPSPQVDIQTSSCGWTPTTPPPWTRAPPQEQAEPLQTAMRSDIGRTKAEPATMRWFTKTTTVTNPSTIPPA
ncbi:MAG: hypothetical protein VX821_06490, partial [Verrucomicrobiota bacterium]|nr:hypothetical protein [Verrucomicrobiota bacterium]